MKIRVTKGAAVNTALLMQAGHEVTQGGKADAEIAWKGPSGTVPRERTILLQSEPPVAGARLALYARHADFLAVGCYMPQADNEFPLTDTPAYPYRPAYSLWEGMTPRPKRGTGIYFAGRRPHGVPDGTFFGGRRQYQLRATVADTLRQRLGGVCLGEGWPTSTKAGTWHRTKAAEVGSLDPDFVCGFENCVMANYVSEKFWDAVLSRRLAIYLGDPMIGVCAGGDSFVDLRGVHAGSIHEMADYLGAMDVDEYMARIERQTRQAMSFEGAWERRRDEVTRRCVDILEGTA